MQTQMQTETRERPILFSGEMVRAILEGRKTVTRRVIKNEWFRCLDPQNTDDMPNILAQCPFGKPGDRLWVRETWQPIHSECDIFYKSDESFGRFLDQSEWFEKDWEGGERFNLTAPTQREYERRK